VKAKDERVPGRIRRRGSLCAGEWEGGREKERRREKGRKGKGREDGRAKEEGGKKSRKKNRKMMMRDDDGPNGMHSARRERDKGGRGRPAARMGCV